MLSDLLPGVAVMTSTGVSPRGGATASDPDLARLKQVAMSSCRQRMLVGEHPAFEGSGPFRFAAVEDFDVMVTDRGLSLRTVERYVARTVRVVLA